MAKRRSIALALLGLFSFWNQAHAQIVDHFEGVLTDWQGNTELFVIENGRLISDSEQSNDTFFLSQHANGLHEYNYWELDAELKFRTSSANYVDFIIASDTEDLSASENAFYIRIGNTGDEISLYRIRDGQTELLIDGVDKSIDFASTRLRVALKLAKGEAQLLRLVEGQDQNWVSEGRTLVTIPASWTHTGLRIRQSTASFFGKHEFESFYVGPLIRDTLPPRLTDWQLVSDSILLLQFNEELNDSKGAFSWLNQGPDILNSHINESAISLLLSQAIPENQDFGLLISGVEDTSSNMMKDTLLQVFRLQLSSADRHDILINELMPKPEPVVGLQPYEYVELMNRSDKWIQLSGLSLSDLTGSVTLPDFVLRPDSIVVLFPSAARGAFPPYPNTLFVEGLPSLNNAGDDINLRRLSDGLWIHGLTYTEDTYGDAFKASGGWSLELIDPNSPCDRNRNISASSSPAGGTPGTANSLRAPLGDRRAARLTSAFYDQTMAELRLQFDQELGLQMLKQSYTISPELPVDTVSFNNETRTGLSLSFQTAAESGLLYTLSLDSSYTCYAGYKLDEKIEFGIPARMCSGCMLINEVLYNEPQGGSDYIELYNPTDSLFDLEDVRMILGRTDGSVINVLDFALDNKRQIGPGAYLCLTENAAAVKNFYEVKDERALFEHSQALRLNSDGGYVSLRHAGGQLIDSFAFDDERHHVLLDETDGVSLERINPASASWTSASSLFGFGTPGSRNSQWVSLQSVHSAEMKLNPRIISPNGDGMNDLLEISFNLLPQSRLTVKVFDLSGKEVNTLLNNAPVGTESSFFWDGRDAEGQAPPAGIYVILAEGFEPSGEIYRFKQAVSLTYP